MFKHKKIGLGGTFDHFHKGHQAFLLSASQWAEHMVIGITTPEMLSSKKFRTQIETYEKRAEQVKKFTKNFLNKVDVIPLTDIYGPTLAGSSVDSLAATSATKSGLEAINSKRVELGMDELPMYVCELVDDENGNPISSEKIRAGKLSRSGKVYKNIFKSNISLSNNQKKVFSEIQGTVVRRPSPAELTLVVGDTSLEKFIDNDWKYSLGVLDFLKNRKTYQPTLDISPLSAITAHNQPGSISHDLVEALVSALKTQQSHVIVEGEEDLAAVALVLLAPLGTHIYYGQPNVGMVEMIVTEEKKDFCFKTLSS